jgi:hypothetical protein
MTATAQAVEGVVGVTATRSGLTPAQAKQLLRLLNGEMVGPVSVLHHGDCLGGDADADAIARALSIRRVIHPPDNPELRAMCEPGDDGTVLEERPYKERNRDIVNASWLMVALPATMREQRYGGTWSTVRYARSVGRPLVLILPNGDVHMERCDGLGS